MTHSMRFDLYKWHSKISSADIAEQEDERLEKRMRLFLNNPNVGEFDLVDAFCYDNSWLPQKLQDLYYVDMCLIYGITNECEMVTKWVAQQELHSDKEIVDGEII